MKKIPKILGVVATIALVGMNLSSCGGGTKDDSDSDSVVVNQSDEEDLTKQPKHARVFIDASGSMADYFGSENYGAIYKALCGVGEVTQDEVEYYVWGDMSKPMYKEVLQEKLLKKELKGKATAFDQILAPMAEMSANDSICILLTDGILSSSSDKTKLDENFTDLAKGNLTQRIQKALSGKGKAISIYRMMGNFDGIYYNKANQKVTYKGERPFFILVMGSPVNVRYFDQEVKDGNVDDIYKNAEALHIGTAPKMTFMIEPEHGENEEEYAETDELAPVADSENTYHYEGERMFRVSGELPEWIKEQYSDNTIKAMSEILIDGKPLNLKPEIDDETLYFDIPAATVEQYLTSGKTYKISYQMKDPAAGAWDKYSTDDDTTPDSSQTYLLSDFIESLRKGINGKDKTLIEGSMTIIPQPAE